MGGNVESIKERLDIAEIIGSYVKLEKSGINFKAKCPFHTEKTASFVISTARQSYYCFGCGAKGDIFSFVQAMDGLDFKGALKTLAERAGVELKYERGESKGEKDKLYSVLEVAKLFFETELEKNPEAKKYLASRGVSEESIKTWRLGFAPDEWRTLREHMKTLGYEDETLTKVGLIKKSAEHADGEPYDIFRGRIIFPISDTQGRVIAFSGRALAKETEPKYLNSPDTVLFTKGEVLYGLDKAKDDVRKKNYAVLVEGQLDLVLSHQAGVNNTVASSGTAFTGAHLERLKKLSTRLILAFDGDLAGQKAALKSATLSLALGLEPKVAQLPGGQDPADLAKGEGESWRDVLRASKPAIEVFLDEIVKEEKDARKAVKLIEKKILPLVLLVQSAMERSHFVSLIAKKTGIKEEVIAEDLRRAKTPAVERPAEQAEEVLEKRVRLSREDELKDKLYWLEQSPKDIKLLRDIDELKRLIRIDEIEEEITKEKDHQKILDLQKERDRLK